MIPSARGLWLAENVFVDSVRRNLTLENCFRSHRATWFPAELTRFFVVAHLVNGSGKSFHFNSRSIGWTPRTYFTYSRRSKRSLTA